jgi:hypothetical protein
MPRPDFITQEHIDRYQTQIQDDSIVKQFQDIPLIMEVCYAGCYLEEELKKLNCPEGRILDLQFHAGRASFGRDPWDVHLQLLEEYRNGTVEFEEDPLVLN